MPALYLASPRFSNDHITGDVPIMQTRATVNAGANNHSVAADIRSVSAPQLRTNVRVDPTVGQGLVTFRVGCGSYALQCDRSHSHSQAGQPGVSFSSGFLWNSIPPQPPIQLHRLRFYVVGFPDLQETIDVQVGDWHVWISRGTLPALERVRTGNAGAHALTNIGEIGRIDGTDFTTDDLIEFLEFVSRVLSFIKGGWCTPELLEGFNRNQDLVWEDLALRGSTAVNPHLTWFPRSGGVQTLNIFQLCWAKWVVQNDRLLFEHLVSVYSEIASNSLAMELRLLIAQTALETLSWTLLVSSGTMAESAFKGLAGGAAGRLRQALTVSGVPLGIPAGLADLVAQAGTSGWTDGPNAIVYLRNRLIHPNAAGLATLSGVAPECMDQAADLAVYYVERMLLHWLGYAGYMYVRTAALADRDNEQIP